MNATMNAHTTMTERRAFGTLRLRGRIWWVRYKVKGKAYDESSESSDRRKAEKLLARREAELLHARFHPVTGRP